MFYPLRRPQRFYRRLPARVVSLRRLSSAPTRYHGRRLLSAAPKRNRRRNGAGRENVDRGQTALRALIEHRHRAAVLRPAGNVVAHRDRPFLAVGDGVHALRRDPAGDKILAHGLRAAGAERDIVFARAALVGMTFDGEGVVIVVAEPLRLLVERRPRLLGQLRGIGFEEHAVADIDDEVLLAAGRGGAADEPSLLGLLLSAARDRERGDDKGREFGAAEDAHHVHSGASIVAS